MPADDDIDVLARTLWGEARGEQQPNGMEAVASVILNRVRARRFPNNIRDVIFQRSQFSAWNQSDPNRPRMLRVNDRDPQFRQALEIAQRATAGKLVDRTGGADHYHANWIATPSWARGRTPTARIGRHVFYRLG